MTIALRGELRADMTARDDLRRRVAERFQSSIDVPTRFFAEQADTITQACRAMAGRFEAGGRLLVFADEAHASDVHHVAVEFVHPVLVGKRALPAIPLPVKVAGRGSRLNGEPSLPRDAGPDADPVSQALSLIGGEHDIAMGIATRGTDALDTALRHARAMRMLTLALVADGAHAVSADFVFAVPSDDPLVVQEVHEQLYHVLWELVHVFFEGRGTHV